MTDIALIAFAVTFIAGPILCALALRLPPTLRTMIALATLVVVASALAILAEGRTTGLSLLLMWLGWIAACAMIGQALFRRLPGARARRWITVGAILATTLPWFGLATAQLMV